MDLLEVSLNSSYNDPGEPDTGFLPKGKVRKLGIKSNKPRKDGLKKVDIHNGVIQRKDTNIR